VPEFHGSLDTGYLKGLGALDGRMLILVEVEGLITSEGMGLVAASVQ
jgi:purine-binding chemotaxis protein CheW